MIIGDLIVLFIVYVVIAAIFGIIDMNIFDDITWRVNTFDLIVKIRKVFVINLFYVSFQCLVTVIWISLYPFIFIVKYMVHGLGFLWLFKLVK